MLSLTVTLVVLALSWTLAYVGAPLLVWTAVVTVAYAALLVAGLLGTAGAAILGVPLLLLLAFNIVTLRRGVLTRGLFERFKAVMPEMSQTERDALEAGDTWWETEMFRGRPNWKQLLDFPRTEYTEEEQAFLDNQCATLCAMINDWQIDFELREIPAPVMDYIREQRFLAMLISMPLLSAIFSVMAIGIAGGHAVGVSLLGVDDGSYWGQIRASVEVQDIVDSLIKSTLFGFAVAWIAVYQGYHAAPTSEGVSRATTSTVVLSSLAILALDFVLTAFMFR